MTTARPQALDELIGQERIKQKARIAIGAALQRGEPLPHALLTSPEGGLGKTSFASILAAEMYADIKHTSGPGIRTVIDLRAELMQLTPSSMLHIDECHAMGKSAAEELLLVLEEGVIRLKLDDLSMPVKLPPFAMVCSTIRPSALTSPLRQRFGLNFDFDFYTLDELRQIAGHMANRLDLCFEDEVCYGIAARSLGIPRICLRLAERVRDVVQTKGLAVATIEELELAMRIEGIDSLGLCYQHRQILRALADAQRGLSARSLALILGTSTSTITEVLEPPLVRLGLATICSGGRRITEFGMAHVDASGDER